MRTESMFKSGTHPHDGIGEEDSQVHLWSGNNTKLDAKTAENRSGWGGFYLGGHCPCKICSGPCVPYDLQVSTVVFPPTVGRTRVSEQDSFVHSGMFPWYNLPVEIRLKILRFALSRYFKYSAVLQKSCVEVEVASRAEYNLKSLLYSESFGLSKLHGGVPTSQWEGFEPHYRLQQKHFNKVYRSHPSRNPGWIYFVRLNYETDEPVYTKAVEAKALKDLAGVSASFRNELANVLWENAVLKVGAGYTSRIDAAVGFLLDRPLVAESIKVLDYKVKLDSVVLCYNRKRACETTISMLKDLLKLDVLSLTIALTQQQIVDEAITKPIFWSWLPPAIRALKVEKQFRLRVEVTRLGGHSANPVPQSLLRVCDLSLFPYRDSEKQYMKEINRLYLDDLEQALKPDSLRREPCGDHKA